MIKKGIQLFSLITSLAILGGGSLPANGQGITEAQIRGLRQKIEREVQREESLAIPQNPSESPALREYRQFWQNRNPEIARFAGQWGGNRGGYYTIYPTNEPNMVQTEIMYYLDKTTVW